VIPTTRKIALFALHTSGRRRIQEWTADMIEEVPMADRARTKTARASAREQPFKKSRAGISTSRGDFAADLLQVQRRAIVDTSFACNLRQLKTPCKLALAR
jgi:hypothetical protein